MLFSLKRQRHNRQNTLAVDPAEGKTGKKLYFSPYCGDGTTTYYNRAFLFGSVLYMVVLFHQYTEIYAFYPFFPLAGPVTGGFYWLFP